VDAIPRHGKGVNLYHGNRRLPVQASGDDGADNRVEWTTPTWVQRTAELAPLCLSVEFLHRTGCTPTVGAGVVAPFAAWLCACVAAKRRNTRRDSTHH
jgi:hypothetical protein